MRRRRSSRESLTLMRRRFGRKASLDRISSLASADTGVRWTHNALKPHYRGWDGVTANHDFNWHDSIHDGVGNPCGNDSPVPCDDFFHGSHTTGTAIGDDGAGNQIGMAPGAKWIACRNMDRARAHRPDTSSAWNFSWRPTRWAADRATRPKHLTLPLTPGAARFRKVVRLHSPIRRRSSSRCWHYDGGRSR